MKLYSTNNKNNIVDLREATMNSLPKDKGLYMPISIPHMESDFLNNLTHYSFPELAYRISKKLFDDFIPSREIERICYASINFPAPVVSLTDDLYTLELFHGPSLAFKDFGARYMAELMSYFIKDENTVLTILVATSGDTGGAVAAGFHGIENIEVIILYPSGKVSPLQEKQLTTWGDNITAVEWEGTFDDCQSVVKKAFLDERLTSRYKLSSANSINIARLIPQSFYYFEAAKQLGNEKELIVSVPSGNIGNISAASLARNMGLPINKLIAAHNSNNTVKEYFNSGSFNPKPSVPTISNAMDVGNPSNFHRFEILNGSTWNNVKNNNSAVSYNDEQTAESLKKIYDDYNYISEPHAAVAFRALTETDNTQDKNLLFLGTAHPAKFQEIVEEILDITIELPETLKELRYKKKEAIKISNEYELFVDFMISRKIY